MTRTERERRDGQPECTRPGEGAGPLAEHVHEDDPLVQHLRTDDPLAEPAHDGGPLAEEAQEKDRLAEPAPGAAGVAAGVGTSEAPHALLAGPAENERFMARWREVQGGFVDDPRGRSRTPTPSS